MCVCPPHPGKHSLGQLLQAAVHVVIVLRGLLRREGPAKEMGDRVSGLSAPLLPQLNPEHHQSCLPSTISLANIFVPLEALGPRGTCTPGNHRAAPCARHSSHTLTRGCAASRRAHQDERVLTKEGLPHTNMLKKC